MPKADGDPILVTYQGLFEMSGARCEKQMLGFDSKGLPDERSPVFLRSGRWILVLDAVGVHLGDNEGATPFTTLASDVFYDLPWAACVQYPNILLWLRRGVDKNGDSTHETVMLNIETGVQTRHKDWVLAVDANGRPTTWVSGSSILQQDKQKIELASKPTSISQVNDSTSVLLALQGEGSQSIIKITDGKAHLLGESAQARSVRPAAGDGTVLGMGYFGVNPIEKDWSYELISINGGGSRRVSVQQPRLAFSVADRALVEQVIKRLDSK